MKLAGTFSPRQKPLKSESRENLLPNTTTLRKTMNPGAGQGHRSLTFTVRKGPGVRPGCNRGMSAFWMQNRVRLGLPGLRREHDWCHVPRSDASTAVTGLWREDELPCKYERARLSTLGKSKTLSRGLFSRPQPGARTKKGCF